MIVWGPRECWCHMLARFQSWPPCWLLASKFRFWVFGLSFWLVGRGKDGESPQCRVSAAEGCTSWAPAATAGCGRCRRVCSVQQPVQCGGRSQSHRLQPNHWNQGQGRFLGSAIEIQIMQELQTYCMRSCLKSWTSSIAPGSKSFCSFQFGLAWAYGRWLMCLLLLLHSAGNDSALTWHRCWKPKAIL